jgi:hypothetical protein
LHGTVFVGCTEDDVLEAVPFLVAVPFREVVVLALPTKRVSVGLDVVVSLLDLVIDDVAVPLDVAKMLERSVTVA